MNEQKLTGNPYLDFYLPKLEEHGTKPEGAGWRSEKELLVFGQFDELFSMAPRFSINDLGCGNGALLNYLIKKNFIFDYVGYDVLSDMIGFCKENYPDADFRLITDSGQMQPADISIASGLLNLNYGFSTEEFTALAYKIIENLDASSTMGFAFNGLRVPDTEDGFRDNLFYWKPEELSEYCRSRFPGEVILKKDYYGIDFTIVVKKSIFGN